LPPEREVDSELENHCGEVALWFNSNSLRWSLKRVNWFYKAFFNEAIDLYCITERLLLIQNIDDLNWQILNELQCNARATYAEIGKVVGLTAPAVAQRIQKMEDEGVITGYHAAIDLEKIGLGIVVIIQMGQLKCETSTVVKALEAMPEIIECYTTTGSTCLFLKAAVPSVRHLQRLNEALGSYGFTTTSLVLTTPIPRKVLEHVE
jgi:Lrp/AsnC family transcriptional regulator, leucine-responsive regulatory protein